MSKLWRIIASIAFFGPPLAWNAARQYRAIPPLPVDDDLEETLPSLSVIIPARNEAKNLQRLLPSLLAVPYPGMYEVIVVDDGSTDTTAEVASNYQVRLIQLTDLPADWLGKPHACHQAVQAAKGEWVLFTDADTIHASNGPIQAMCYAIKHNLDGLSLLIADKI